MEGAYLDFWGKARPTQNAAWDWHPAACHGLDVAAVAEAYMSARPATVRPIADLCGWEPEAFVRTMVFLIALHDLGKFSRPFQAKVPAHWPAALGPYKNVSGPRHDELGLRLLRDREVGGMLREFLPGWADGSVELLLDAIAGHHGRPVQCPLPSELRIVCVPCRNAARGFAAAARDLLAPSPLTPPPAGAAAVASWWLAGLVTLCDWIGSATGWFPYEGAAVTALALYWPKAQRRAKAAVAESGLLPAPSGIVRGLARLMPQITKPTPMQVLAETLELPDGPLSILIEDATGGGKTEAALLFADRLMAEGRADGLFIALPTMATADAMFDRLAESYRRLFADDAQPSLALAHGHAALNDLFQGSILATAAAGPELEAADAADTASAQCAAWLAQERRRVFFADVGVGTIDQALLAVLATRYAALRLFGLSRKVLVVDEAHAYDPYMSEELDRLLTFHARLGGSSIILSATLPQARRATLLRAIATGLGAKPHVPAQTDYPLLTVAAREGSFEQAASMREALKRVLPVRRLGRTAEAVAALAEAARKGACCIWIRNTVDDARTAAEAMREVGIVPILFHARFAMGDRLAIQRDVLRWFGKEAADRAPGGIGRVLVATQVVEQSLDLDADVMVTDLAPIELLIQRAGRLQRHPGRERPAGLGKPELLVLSPDPVELPGSDWAVDGAIGGTRFVYPPTVLWRSARALFTAASIDVPDGIRPLMEAVYGDEVELPANFAKAEAKRQGDGMAQRNHARTNLLEPQGGYHYANGQWASDVVMPTRLGDDYVTFRMAREENGVLVPWCSNAKAERAWASSEIALRRSIADAEDIPAHLLPTVARLRAGWKAWQRDIPLLVMEPKASGGFRSRALSRDKAVQLDYDSKSGLNPHTRE